MKTRVSFKYFVAGYSEETITIHIVPNISWSKDNQTIELGTIFRFVFFLKPNIKYKPVVCCLALTYFDRAQGGIQ